MNEEGKLIGITQPNYDQDSTIFYILDINIADSLSTNAFSIYDRELAGINIMKALHLPLQSGSDNILLRMNRHYTNEKYLYLVDELRKRIPDIYLTTDIIVGFPNETDEDFEKTIELCNKVKFDNAFTFIYSKRDGTPAAKMQDKKCASINAKFNSSKED